MSHDPFFLKKVTKERKNDLNDTEKERNYKKRVTSHDFSKQLCTLFLDFLKP